MHVSSHGYWTHRIVRGLGASRPGWTALGATLPDLPAAALTVGLATAGRAWRVAGDEAFAERFEPVHRVAHSALVPVVVVLLASGGSRAASLALGWIGHIAVDLVSHHADARPPAWPLSHRVWRSPISHWEADHHAAAWNAADALGLLLAASREAGGRRLAALGTAAVSAAGLVEALRGRPGQGEAAGLPARRRRVRRRARR